MEEYIARVGQQAAVIYCTPGKSQHQPHYYKVVGSQPLQNIVSIAMDFQTLASPSMGHWGMCPLEFQLCNIFLLISARQHICYSALFANARPSVPLSPCLSVTRVDQSKPVTVRITQLSPQTLVS